MECKIVLESAAGCCGSTEKTDKIREILKQGEDCCNVSGSFEIKNGECRISISECCPTEEKPE